MMRVGHGFDAHRLVLGRKLMLGGVEIPSHVGALGHSDADVVCHAISDALLGAAALGDLGGHFPDSDPQWKDADSLVLLEACIQRVREAGYTVNNVDATIVVDKPKLAPYIGAMRETLATRLGIALECVSVKAKTSEGMGYTGDGTGIAAYAVAMICR
jgi:2-C-methyl-D-erythritol 2,4-cyclodiphosphate synthase